MSLHDVGLVEVGFSARQRHGSQAGVEVGPNVNVPCGVGALVGIGLEGGAAGIPANSANKPDSIPPSSEAWVHPVLFEGDCSIHGAGWDGLDGRGNIGLQEVGAFHGKEEHIAVDPEGVPESDGAGGAEVYEVVEEISGGRVADDIDLLEYLCPCRLEDPQLVYDEGVGVIGAGPDHIKVVVPCGGHVPIYSHLMLHGEGDAVGHSEASRLRGEGGPSVVQNLRHEHAGGIFGGPQEVEGEVDSIIGLQGAKVVAS